MILLNVVFVVLAWETMAEGLMQAPPRLELEPQPQCTNPAGWTSPFMSTRVLDAERNNGIMVGCRKRRYQPLGVCWRQRSFGSSEYCWLRDIHGGRDLRCLTHANCAGMLHVAFCPNGQWLH